MTFGLIGAGGIGRVRAAALAATPGCRLSAVADLDLGRARAAAPPGTPCFSEYRELLARSDAEAVVVSTPPAYHEEIALAALEAGKHVLCEKPLAHSLPACRRMVEA